MGKAVIIQFWIGPIPISIWYEIPVTVTASASINAQLNVEAGATAKWAFGDAYVSYTQEERWKLHKPKPKFTWTPILKASGNFKASGELKIQPAFILHFMRIVQMFVRVTPGLFLEAEGDLDKKEACIDLSCNAIGEAGASIHINIPLIRIRYDKVFGPYKLFDSGIKKIVHWCIKG